MKMTESIRFVAESSSNSGKDCKARQESVSVLRDVLPKFSRICLCNGYCFKVREESVPVTGNVLPPE